MQAYPILSDGPIGIFDSGVGGLSVLRHIRQTLPHEDLLYFADSGFAPYGDKPDQVIQERVFAIVAFLLERGAKAIVVACNTATAAAIEALRSRYPELPLVGVEPGLKPAASLTQTKIVGVMATRGTLFSKKFMHLHDQIVTTSHIRFLLQPCAGLASQIERGELDSEATVELVKRYLAPLVTQNIDTLVLGCTHYPFILPVIEEGIRALGGCAIQILDTGAPVSRQLHKLLINNRLTRTTDQVGVIQGFTSGRAQALAVAFDNLLDLAPPVSTIILA